MKVNVRHMLRMAGNDAGSAFRHSLPELADNLLELRDRSREGPSEAAKACEEFFAIYVFGDEKPASFHVSNGPQECTAVQTDGAL